MFSLQVESDYCLLLALPCGRDQEDVVNQTESLKAAFISYLQAKQAAGIINVPNPGSNQVPPGKTPQLKSVDTGPSSLPLWLNIGVELPVFIIKTKSPPFPVLASYIAHQNAPM